MSDSITSVIGLKETDVDYCREVLRKNKGLDHHLIYVRLVNRGRFCPNCGSFTKRIKEYRTKNIEHATYLNERCTIIYSARRFLCTRCGTTFFEKDPFESQYSGISDKTVENILKLLKEYNQTFSSVAKVVGISKTEVIKIFDEHVQVERKPLSECVGMDEFYFSRHASHKYALLILSLNKGYVIDMRSSREKHRIISYFRSIPKEERDIVKYFSIDMNDNYREAISVCFPKALICIDPFHVIKNLNKALDNIRLRILRLYSDDKKYRVSEKRMQEMMFAIHPDLFKAWQLKERYMSFDSEDLSYEQRLILFNSLIDDCISSDIPEMISIGLTLNNWHDEILNSFHTITKKVTSSNGTKRIITTRVTNGPVEGRNKYIKILLNLANGYQNFMRFRNRAMYVLNRAESFARDKLKPTRSHKKRQ